MRRRTHIGDQRFRRRGNGQPEEREQDWRSAIGSIALFMSPGGRQRLRAVQVEEVPVVEITWTSLCCHVDPGLAQLGDDLQVSQPRFLARFAQRRAAPGSDSPGCTVPPDTWMPASGARKPPVALSPEEWERRRRNALNYQIAQDLAERREAYRDAQAQRWQQQQPPPRDPSTWGGGDGCRYC